MLTVPRLAALLALGWIAFPSVNPALGLPAVPPPASAEQQQPPVDGLSIAVYGTDMRLDWAPSPQMHPATAEPLRGYLICFGALPDSLALLARRVEKSFVHIGAASLPHGFYRVVADYGARPLPRRDDLVLLDFEDGELELLPYSEAEDIDPDAWEVTDREAFEGSRSLRLFGNSWKQLAIEPLQLADSTVWRIAILSIDGDTLADLQGFGLGDGEESLFYACHGMRRVWEHPWSVVYQDINPRGDWEQFHAAVGYDWNIRFGYLPSVTELYFINDNDSNDPPSELYIDDLVDVTESAPEIPGLSISWRYSGPFNPQAIDLGSGVAFNAEVALRRPVALTHRWEFGDGAVSDQECPTHYYSRAGEYTAALTVQTVEGMFGWARTTVTVGESPQPQRMTACFVGDVMLARRYEQPGGIIDRLGPEAVFERVRERIQAPDLACVNLESVLTDEGERHPTKSIAFRGSPENVAGLTFAGFDLAALANNHAHDYGRRGLEETQQVLDSAGIGWCGAGMNEYQALGPVFRTVRGIRVGMLAYCNRTGRDYNERPYGDAGYDRFGFAYFSADNILRSVPYAAGLCDLLVVYVHGGWEYADEPGRDRPGEEYPPWHEERIRFTAKRDSATRELEHLAIDLGAGLVIGSHPHVLQGFEIYRGVLIAHSMGNFAFDQNFFETWPSAMVMTEIERSGVASCWIEPLFVDNYLPTPATGTLAGKIIDRLAGYSQELGTLLIPDREGMRAVVAFDTALVERREDEFTVAGTMRFDDTLGVYRSEPLRMMGGGSPCAVVSIAAEVEDPEWRVSLGREILLVGNMELEGADIWNYNSDWESRVEDVVHSGGFASHLARPARWQDAVTDLKQRIPVEPDDRLTLCGWLQTTNARDAGLAARFYRYRYDNDPRNILGDQVVEQRLQGDNDWTYLWARLALPEDTWFLNVRWQLFGPEEGEGHLWCDDVELISWEEPVLLEGELQITCPSDIYWLQLETDRQVDAVEVTYRTATFDFGLLAAGGG